MEALMGGLRVSDHSLLHQGACCSYTYIDTKRRSALGDASSEEERPWSSLKYLGSIFII